MATRVNKRCIGVAAAALAMLLSSCTTGPQYTKPTVPAAPEFGEQAPQSFQETPGWKTAQPSDAMMKGKWWEIFGDAELNGYEEQVEPANQTLKIAEANFREARAAIQYQRSFRFPTVSAGPSITSNRISTHNPTGGARFAVWRVQFANQRFL